MPSALSLRTDYSPGELRRLAKKTKDNNQSRRLLSLAAVLDGMNRTDAARIGGMDRQTLRDWVHRFNNQGPDGLSHQCWHGRIRLIWVKAQGTRTPGVDYRVGGDIKPTRRRPTMCQWPWWTAQGRRIMRVATSNTF